MAERNTRQASDERQEDVFGASNPSGNRSIELQKRIGKGPRSTVFSGYDTTLHTPVIIKQFHLTEPLNPRLNFFLKYELPFHTSLDQFYTVQYLSHHYNKETRNLNVCYEHIPEGKPLNQLMEKCGGFNEEITWLYICEVVSALKALHHQGIIHRRLKASNVIVSGGGMVKLSDYGLDISLEDLDCSDREYYSDIAYYLPPEAIKDHPITTASDIWALGCLTLELISGGPPFSSFAVPDALYHIVSGTSPPLPNNISSKLQHFLSLCFKPFPKDRPTASQLLTHEWITSSLYSNGETKTTERLRHSFHLLSGAVEKPTSMPSISKHKRTRGLSSSSPSSSPSKSRLKRSRKNSNMDRLYHSDFANHATIVAVRKTSKTKSRTKLPSKHFSHNLRAKVRLPEEFHIQQPQDSSQKHW
eukprot:CAMPEP_0206185242 /NCGR_PEP_ID=MMETSP0166-20121206/1691_1 /ASSEMBLY_ACC=CAM_ASM_000260 /TAXON_ID=95228 /ORGANISM="Vannella robusta, Strain DIVA3 518/3/11/1/6" /LENGTH=415 /DNA_ID=CAMNT_0053600399 /DNA_START=19 /DNA_END=1263 /DNA_ORIENTATION=-